MKRKKFNCSPVLLEQVLALGSSCAEEKTSEIRDWSWRNAKIPEFQFSYSTNRKAPTQSTWHTQKRDWQCCFQEFKINNNWIRSVTPRRTLNWQKSWKSAKSFQIPSCKLEEEIWRRLYMKETVLHKSQADQRIPKAQLSTLFLWLDEFSVIKKKKKTCTATRILYRMAPNNGQWTSTIRNCF